jgi:HK97 family phage major capsid protein
MDQDLKDILDAQGRAWEEFKRTNEERIKQAAAGAVDPLITAKIERLNVELEEKATARDKKFAEQSESLVGSINRVEEQLTAIKMQGQEAKDGLTAEQKEIKAAHSLYLRKGIESKAMSAQSDPDGGYTVHPDMGGRIVQRIYETSPMRQNASIVSISTDRIQGLKDTDQAGATWVGEVPSGHSTTTPALGLWTISVNQLAAEPTITQVLLEDSSFGVESWLEGKLADYFGRTENTAFVTGDGVLKPRGFASYTTAATADGSRTWGVFEHVVTGTSATFGTDPTGAQKLISLVHKLNPAYLGNAKFYMNRSTLSTLRQLTDASSQGKFIFVPSFQANMPDTVLGYPVVRFEDMADMAANSLSVSFGDLKETYTIVDRVGISTLRDPLTSKGNVKFYTRKRVGGDVVNFNSLKFLKFST